MEPYVAVSEGNTEINEFIFNVTVYQCNSVTILLPTNRIGKLLHCYIGIFFYSSLLTKSIENAGRQMAIYSQDSENGLL